MQIARLNKTTSIKLGRIDCVNSGKNICENTRGHRQTEKRKIYRFISHIKGPSIPCYFLAPDQMLCRSTVLMGGILSPKNRLFFGIVYGYGARTYSVVTSFGVFVDSTQGHKTTLLPLHRPFL